MIKNGRYYLSPHKSEDDFKQLFTRIVSTGAGRPVDKNGFPNGAWTPDLLADAISQIDANGSGIELRTVQLWFQENNKGISADNIRWLARVVGCDDPEAISEWQIELRASQSRLISKRRVMRKGTPNSDAVGIQDVASSSSIGDDAIAQRKPSSLASRSEALFDGRSSLNLPIVVWSTGALLWFLSYIMGVHSITYSPLEGLNKEVGFFSSPSWTIGEMVFLPVFLIFVAELLTFWKDEGRSPLAEKEAGISNDDSWICKVESFSFSYWAIFLVCFLIIFLVQWSGVYLIALMQGQSANGMVDWILVALEHPEIISTPAAIGISMFAFLYSGMIYWFYFIGFLLLYTIANDFNEIYSAPELRSSKSHQYKAHELGTKIMRGVFRCTVLGILLATCIKLNAAYLISDGETIVMWLINDALSAFGLRDDSWGWLNQNPSPFFTSFLLLFITCFVFFACLAQIYWALERSTTLEAADNQRGNWQVESQVRKTNVSWLKMIIVVVLLAVNYVLIGQFFGFSILLCGNVLLATYSLFWRTQMLEVKQQELNEPK